MLGEGLINSIQIPKPLLAFIVKAYIEMRILFPIYLGSSKAKCSPSVPKVPGSNPMPAGSYYIYAKPKKALTAKRLNVE